MADPISLDEAKRVSKSRAQRALRVAFLEARFQTIDNPPGTPPGFETWQVWCKGNYGAMIALVEITALPVALPLACLREAFKRIGHEVTVSAKAISARPFPPKEKPATAPEKPATQVASPPGLEMPVNLGEM